MAEYFTIEGHLTDYALNRLIAGEPDELRRLEISEHLAFCDTCIDRYTAMLADETLLETPDLLTESILTRIRKKARALWMNQYFSASLAAAIAMVLWVTGVFDTITFRSDNKALSHLQSTTHSFSAAAGEVTGAITKGLSDFINSIDLRGVFENEKK